MYCDSAHWSGSEEKVSGVNFSLRDVSVEFTISTAGTILLSIYKLPNAQG